MKILLHKPLKHKGEDLTELDLNLEELTGYDLIEVEQQVNNSNDGRAILMPEYSKNYLITVAARALHMPVEALKQLSARDFTNITRTTQNFLLASDSVENTETDGGTATLQPEN